MQNLDKILDILSHFHTERPTLQLFIPLFVIFSSSLLLTDRFTKSKVHNFTTLVLKFIKYFIFQLSFLLIFNYFCLVYLYTFSNNVRIQVISMNIRGEGFAPRCLTPDLNFSAKPSPRFPASGNWFR